MTNKEKTNVKRLHTLLADILEMDESLLKEKLKKLPDRIIEEISSNNRVIITGVLEIKPDLLDAGEHLNTFKNEYVYVPARIAPRVSLHQRFSRAVKEKRLNNLNFY